MHFPFFFFKKWFHQTRPCHALKVSHSNSVKPVIVDFLCFLVFSCFCCESVLFSLNV